MRRNPLLLFGFRLAREFKRSDVRVFLNEMSWEDFRWWLAYYEVEPWGEERDDLRAGVVASAVYNVNRSKRTDKVWNPSDFLLVRPDTRHRGPCRQLTDENEWNNLMMYARAMAEAR